MSNTTVNTEERELFTEGECVLSKNSQVVFIGVNSICSTHKHSASEEQNRANAARIVKAWNCHDDLYSALKDASATLMRWAETNEEQWDERDQLTFENIQAVLQKANPNYKS